MYYTICIPSIFASLEVNLRERDVEEERERDVEEESACVSIRQHTSAYVSERRGGRARARERLEELLLV